MLNWAEFQPGFSLSGWKEFSAWFQPIRLKFCKNKFGIKKIIKNDQMNCYYCYSCCKDILNMCPKALFGKNYWSAVLLLHFMSYLELYYDYNYIQHLFRNVLKISIFSITNFSTNVKFWGGRTPKLVLSKSSFWSNWL